jgi:hypothetical protein
MKQIFIQWSTNSAINAVVTKFTVFGFTKTGNLIPYMTKASTAKVAIEEITSVQKLVRKMEESQWLVETETLVQTV